MIPLILPLVDFDEQDAGWHAFERVAVHDRSMVVLHVDQVNKDRWTPLDAAASNGHSEVVRLLLHKDTDVNKVNVTNRLQEVGTDAKAVSKGERTPFYLAAQNGHLNVVDRLLEVEADANAVSKNGWTSFHLAAQNGHLNVVDRLQEVGVDANKDGWTPFHLTAANGHLSIVNRLLELGLHPDDLNDANMSPFHLAAQHGRVEVMESCLRASGDPWLLDGFGRNVLDWTSSYAPARQALDTLYHDYQPTDPDISSRRLTETIRKLLQTEFRDGSSYNFLGYFLLHAGHESEAVVAFEQQIRSTPQGPSIIHQISCYMCLNQDTRGLRYVCRICADVDICEPCFTKYNEGESIRACRGHTCLSVPSPDWRVIDGLHANRAGETLEQWLGRLKVQWNAGRD
ncbi:hypothetical protein LTS12_026079 [Elasticomyces elasticus]|nr:hypothetical protein LTS12_026079 [Elasticomyces elasticus]